jgi:LuxR family maltose regulon positive regulatory protein
VPKIVELSFQYHLVEYELLFGDEERGASAANRVLNEVDMGNLYQFDRLLNHLYSIGKLDPKYSTLFIEQYVQQPEEEIPLSSQLFYIRLLYVQGQNVQALERLDAILAFSRENQNYLRLVEAAILKIVIVQQQGDHVRRLVHNCLLEALHYARQNKILQPFYTDRNVLYPLLAAYHAEASNKISLDERHFLELVIDLCQVGQVELNNHTQEDKELLLLTNRELEVLNELAKGCTKAEIASHLFISVATVKTHMMNIFGKLGVSTRLGAVEEGRRRGWI